MIYETIEYDIRKYNHDLNILPTFYVIQYKINEGDTVVNYPTFYAHIYRYSKFPKICHVIEAISYIYITCDIIIHVLK